MFGLSEKELKEIEEIANSEAFFKAINPDSSNHGDDVDPAKMVEAGKLFFENNPQIVERWRHK